MWSRTVVLFSDCGHHAVEVRFGRLVKDKSVYQYSLITYKAHLHRCRYLLNIFYDQ
jgi:hypothetical protein